MSLKKHKYFKKFTFYLALILLNISVDAPTSNNITYQENLNYNKQESIIEIVFEKIFGEEDAFEEFEDFENNSIQKKDLNLEFQAYISPFNFFNTEILKKEVCAIHIFNLESVFQEVSSPPPQV